MAVEQVDTQRQGSQVVLVYPSFPVDVGNTCIRILAGEENAAYYRRGDSANTWGY